MKVNEIPEKIYIDVSLDSAWGMTERSYDNEVEYTRTDTFIEKVCQWLEDNKDHPFIECEDHQLAGFLTNEFIEDFKNHMKGE